MSDEEPPRGPGDRAGETYGRAGGYNTEPGQSAGGFGNEGEAGGVGPEPGGYTGQTGTGYGRTLGGDADPDQALRDEVLARLAQDPFLDASQIEVSVSGGEVSLAGTVTAPRDKVRAEDLAKAGAGVKRLHNELRVEGGSAS